MTTLCETRPIRQKRMAWTKLELDIFLNKKTFGAHRNNIYRLGETK